MDVEDPHKGGLEVTDTSLGDTGGKAPQNRVEERMRELGVGGGRRTVEW